MNFIQTKRIACSSFALLVSQGLFAERPNIIVFLTDDQDKESIGASGGNVWKPNLDRMAREGWRNHVCLELGFGRAIRTR